MSSTKNSSGDLDNHATQSGRVAVIVPFYKSALTTSEEFSFENTLSILGRHEIYAIGPKKLKNYLEQYKKTTKSDFELSLYPDRFFASISGYNALLMSKRFYQSFSGYQYILIVQADALVFSDQLDAWCDRNYSYVGAPWLIGAKNAGSLPDFLGVGNGGFSLRKVHDFIQFLSMPRYVPNSTLNNYFSKPLGANGFMRKAVHRFIFSYNFLPLTPRVSEDIFWGLLVPSCAQFFRVPAPGDAVSFAFETEPEYLYELNQFQLPFGCHAWEKHLPFWKKVLSERGMQLP